MKSKNLEGERFGKLLVIERAENTKSGKSQWICKCDCGNTTIVPTYRLTMGQTKSCGCKKYETKNQKHGMKNTRIYSIWCDMKRRCNNEKCKNYKDYGAKGIKVCDEWEKNFISFYLWSIDNGYDDTLTIDRINNNKGYSPDNCRWTTRKQQNNNRKCNVLVEYNGHIKTLSTICDEMKLNYEVIRLRISSGMSFEKAISLPKAKLSEKSTIKNRKNPTRKNNLNIDLKEESKRTGINYTTLWARIFEYGWSIEDALSTPVAKRKSENS